MKRLILPVIVFSASLFSPALYAQQNNSASSNAPATLRDKDELQARIYMAKKQYPEAIQVYTKLSQQ